MWVIETHISHHGGGDVNKADYAVMYGPETL